VKDKSHQHKVECRFCKHSFTPGASCIRENSLLINPACGVVKCTADEAVLQLALDEMKACRCSEQGSSNSASLTEIQQQLQATRRPRQKEQGSSEQG